MAQSTALLKLEAIGKAFPGVRALDRIDLEIHPGEIHAIVGENGAGKSTLMNILSGVYPPDEGRLLLCGEPVRFRDTRDAQDRGIAMIHQELSLAPHLSVAENMLIGRLPRTSGGFVSRARLRARASEILARLGVTDFGPELAVSELSTSQMQLVEVGKALSLEARILIMDEPTSSLTLSETEMLLGLMRTLASGGVSILFISHRLDEVFAVADRVSVLRDGQHVATLDRAEARRDRIISLMVGRELDRSFVRTRMAAPAGPPLLEVRNLASGTRVRDVSFSLRAGEVLALTGLVGAGRTETAEAIFGARRVDRGEVLVRGRTVRIRHPAEAVELGLGLVPEGRKIQGIFPNRSVRENMTVAFLRRLHRFGFVRGADELRLAGEYREKLRIKTPSLEQGIKNLSGGNQQKAIFSRWLMNECGVLFLDEPTHGIDVGAKGEIYRIIDALAAKGVGIVLISSELPEVLALADRVLVLREGRVIGELTHEAATQESIMHLSVARAGADGGMPA
jgi:ABC-type sugar transport system ATPase subunit